MRESAERISIIPKTPPPISGFRLLQKISVPHRAKSPIRACRA